jgi:hypothetical protein
LAISRGGVQAVLAHEDHLCGQHSTHSNKATVSNTQQCSEWAVQLSSWTSKKTMACSPLSTQEPAGCGEGTCWQSLVLDSIVWAAHATLLLWGELP